VLDLKARLKCRECRWKGQAVVTGVMLADIAKAKRIPALIVTAYIGWLHERHPKLDINAYKVLSKPVTPRVLLAKVGSAISSH
jgi:hypothetical protein